MGAASELEPDVEQYDPEIGEREIQSRVDDGTVRGAAPAPDEHGDTNYDDLNDEECERLAAAQGWKPLAVYRGPPGKWSNAREFLRRGQAELPILRAQARRLTERVARQDDEVRGLRSEITRQSEILNELRDYARTANEAGYQRALADLERRQDEAAAAGDQAVVKETREQIRALEESRPAAPARAAPADQPRQAQPTQNPELRRALEDIRQREPWIGRDPVLTTAVIERDNHNMAAFPDMPIRERFQLSVDETKREFPQYFPSAVARGQDLGDPTVPARRQPAQPASPSSRGGAAPARAVTSSEKIASITDPAERAAAQASFERFKRQFGPDYSESEFMFVYNNPKGDIRAWKEEQRRNVK